MPSTPSPPAAPAFIGRRMLSLLYDLLPVLALWLLLSAVFTAGYTYLGGHDPHENIAPLSALQWLLWLACWAIGGVYATLSWRRGGQTLGMRPWRIRIVAIDGSVPGRAALWKRYAMGTLSLLVAGLGFWWAWLDRDRLAWHDRMSGTRVVRIDRPSAG